MTVSVAAQPNLKPQQIRQLHRVMDYIDLNLGGQLLLEELAQQACYSPFHLLRLFRDYLGETPAIYVQRLRLERAATLLQRYPKMKITDVALATGFSSAAVFSRAFRKHFAMTPKAWCKQDFWKPCGYYFYWRDQDCSDCPNRTQRSIELPEDFAVLPADSSKPEGLKDVKVVELPEINFAYTRAFGEYGPGASYPQWHKLFAWMDQHLSCRPRMMMAQAMDNPLVTLGTQCRFDAGFIVEQPLPANRFLSSKTIPAGRYLKGVFEGNAQQEAAMIRHLWSNYIPEHGLRVHPTHSGLGLVNTADYSELPKLDQQSTIVIDHYIPLLPRDSRPSIEVS